MLKDLPQYNYLLNIDISDNIINLNQVRYEIKRK